MKHGGRTYSILLVEDDPLIALDAATEIELVGHRCLVVHDQQRALELVRAAEIDAALLDFDLGTETSVPVARALDRAGRPYAFVSGRKRSEIVTQAGPDVTVFPKPADYGWAVHSLLSSLAA